MTGDDAFEFLVAIFGDVDSIPDELDYDELYRSDVVQLIVKLREERDHLRNQLAAASTHLDVMRRERNYPLRDALPWLREDLSTLERLLTTELPSPLEELRRHRERYGRDA